MKLRFLGSIVLAVVLSATGAQVMGETVADTWAQVNLLNQQIQQLRSELVQTGAASGLPRESASALVRLDQLEAELRRLNNRVDVLTNDIDRVVRDASNRVGDIEFRLTELEGGDTSFVGEPELLGGGITRPQPRPVETNEASEPELQLTVTEQADFDAAVSAGENGEHARAVEMFDTFLATYPGGPLSNAAQYQRSESLAAMEDWQNAARSYLSAFSGDPQGGLAPRSLLGLGTSLAKLGQVHEACLTLDEVEIRYPDSGIEAEVTERKTSLSCP